MIIGFAQEAWDDYISLQKTNQKKVNNLIKDICRGDPFSGIGKPKPLIDNLSGAYSRRIDDKNRLVYRIISDPNENILQIISCSGHYSDK